MSQIINPITQPDQILHLCFELDDKIYAMNAEFVMEVTMLPGLITPQKLPENVVGVLNYNGLLINVLDIRMLLNLPKKNYDITNQIIIVKGEESLGGILYNEQVMAFGYIHYSVHFARHPRVVNGHYCTRLWSY